MSVRAAIEHRLATPNDVTAVLSLMREYYREDGYPFSAPRARTVLERLVQEADLGRLWVIAVEGTAVGYCAVAFGFSLEYQGRDAFLDELYVQPASRGRGLGRRALQIAEDACRAAGVRALHLEVERNKARQYDFYRRSGFEDHDRYLLTKWLSAETRTGDA